MTEQKNVRPGANPRMWQGREIQNDMPIALPSVEQMKREVETGEFSPESLAIARSIQAEALGVDLVRIDDEAKFEDPLADVDDWWATQEHFGAPLQDDYLPAMPRKKSFVEKQTDDIMARVTKQITPATAHFKKIATETKKTTKAFKKISKAIPQKPAPGAKLQHRPFLILSAIRDEL